MVVMGAVTAVVEVVVVAAAAVQEAAEVVAVGDAVADKNMPLIKNTYTLPLNWDLTDHYKDIRSHFVLPTFFIDLLS